MHSSHDVMLLKMPAYFIKRGCGKDIAPLGCSQEILEKRYLNVLLPKQFSEIIWCLL